MSARQKAAELVDKMVTFQPMNEDVKIEYDRHKASIRCALVIVDEMIEYLTEDGFPPEIEYWYKVREELNSL